MLSHDELTSRLHYDKDTGIFTYKIQVSNCAPGSVAGRPNTNGHIQISINGVRYMAHNLAWFYVTGEYPINFIVDHKNRIYNDNRWLNFRKATKSQNQGNTKLRKDNSTGVKGVRFNKSKNKYEASITVNGAKIHLGTFNELNEAKKIYDAAALGYFGEFANF